MTSCIPHDASRCRTENSVASKSALIAIAHIEIGSARTAAHIWQYAAPLNAEGAPLSVHMRATRHLTRPHTRCPQKLTEAQA